MKPPSIFTNFFLTILFWKSNLLKTDLLLTTYWKLCLVFTCIFQKMFMFTTGPFHDTAVCIRFSCYSPINYSWDNDNVSDVIVIIWWSLHWLCCILCCNLNLNFAPPPPLDGLNVAPVESWMISVNGVKILQWLPYLQSQLPKDWNLNRKRLG